MSPGLLYVLVLLGYFPGIVALICWRKCWHFPILSIAFLGMFFFNAVGSIGVFDERKIYSLQFDTAEVAGETALVLVFQALVFYVVAGIYVLLRDSLAFKPTVVRIDILAVLVAMGTIVLIGGLYYQETGTFLALASLDGSMTVDNALAFREKYVYGLDVWWFYNIGFVFLPVLLSNYGLIVYKADKRYGALFVLSATVSFAASLSLGSKGGVIGFVLSLGIAYLSYLGLTGQRISLIFRSRGFSCFAAVALAIMIIGYIRATPEDLDAATLLERLWYRIFVAYPETLAAALSYVRNYGALGISVLPTARGLFAHDLISPSVVLHVYQAGASGGVSVPFTAEAFLVGGWPALFLVVPFVFSVLVILQEIGHRLPKGVIAIVFCAVYGYLAVQLAMTGMFSSLFNFVYPATILGLVAIVLVLWMPFYLLVPRSILIPREEP